MSAAAVAVALLAFLGIQPLGALQWRMLLPSPRPPLTRLLRIFSLASPANNGLNSVVGHVASTAMVARELEVGTGRAVALLVLDQLVVGLVKLLVLSVAVVVMWDRYGDLSFASTAIALGIGVAALITLLVAARSLATLPHWIPEWSQRWLEPLHAALRTPHAQRAILAAVPVGVGVRVLESVAVMAVQRAMGLPGEASQLPLFLAATALATLLPVIPANLGTYEGALVGAYLLVGVPIDQALVAAALQHGCQLAAAIIPGLCVAAILSLRAAQTRRAAPRGAETSRPTSPE